MNKKLAICIVVLAIVTVSMFAGCVEEEKAPVATPTPSPVVTPTPTPPLETVSDKVKEIKLLIWVTYEAFTFEGKKYATSNKVTCMKITFEDEWGRSFSKLDDGSTRISMETFDRHLSQIDEGEIKDVEAGKNFGKIYLPNVTGKCHRLNITITLPNGKTTHTSTVFDYSDRVLALEYHSGYEKGAEDARIGYSAKIPWSRSEYYRDGYTDGYIGATPRYIYSPIRKTITIE